MLDIINLSKTYANGHTALQNINVSIEQGELIVVIGASGAGKSTLLRCINRMIDPTEGAIVFNQSDVTQLSKKELRIIRTEMGMIFQHYNLVERLTVFENVLHGRLGHKSSLSGILGIYTDTEKAKAIELMELLRIESKMYQRCSELSGGQKQRVGIARALIQEPKLILCDEPIASLDPKAATKIMDYLQTVVETLHITCVVNLHQVEVAKKYADRIIGMNEGTIIFDGTSDELTDIQIKKIYGA